MGDKSQVGARDLHSSPLPLDQTVQRAMSCSVTHSLQKGPRATSCSSDQQMACQQNGTAHPHTDNSLSNLGT